LNLCDVFTFLTIFSRMLKPLHSLWFSTIQILQQGQLCSLQYDCNLSLRTEWIQDKHGQYKTVCIRPANIFGLESNRECCRSPGHVFTCSSEQRQS
jgi:hypothetical protein